MKFLQIVFLLLLFFLVIEKSKAQVVVLDSSNLPIVVINTSGQIIQDDPRITVSMGIIDNGLGIINHVTDSFNNYNGDVSIEIRGSTSQYYPKKSYAFTPLDSLGNNVEASILGFPSETDWILYAPYPDKTLMRNTLAYYLFNRMGHYTSRTRFVELILNEEYLGVYELHEKIKRDDNRVNISKLTPSDTTGDNLTGGYIIKVDKTTGSGDETWTSSLDDQVFFQYHDPEDEDLLDVQKNYIQNYVNLFETTLNGSQFADPDSGFRVYADENSLIDFLLLEELGRTVDGYRSSCFFFKDKDSKGGKLTMGPAWDYNLSFGNANYCESYLTTGWHYNFNSICPGYYPHVPFWWLRLIQDTTFDNNLQCRWLNFRQSFLDDDSINAWIDDHVNLLQEAQQRNFEKWDLLGEYVDWNYYIGQTYDDEINYMKNWIAARLLWMDTNLPGTCIATTATANSSSNSSLLIYPNPFYDETIIQLPSSGRQRELLVRNEFGRVVMEMMTSDQQVKLHRGDLTTGIYFIELREGNQVTGRGKLIIM